LETSPPNTDGGIDADENEEWTAKEFIEYFFSVDISGNPAFSPLLGDKFKQVICRIEGVRFRGELGFPVDIWDYTCQFRVLFFLFDSRCTIGLHKVPLYAVLSKVDMGEAMMLHEILGDSLLPCTNS
jgi:hypothetical protein